MASIPAVVAAFQIEAKSENVRVSRFLAHTEDPQVVEIDSDTCTTARAPHSQGVTSVRLLSKKSGAFKKKFKLFLSAT